MELKTNELDKCFEDVAPSKKFNYTKIKAMKQWIKTQPHLPKISERQISIFLHTCHNSAELAQTTIENYYTMRTHNPETFNGRTLESVAKICDTIYCIISPTLSLDNSNCVFFGLLDTDPNKYIIPDVGRICQITIDLCSNLYPYSNGWQIFINANGYSFGHLVKVSTSLSYMKAFITYVQCAMPLRLNGIHVYNSFPLVNQIIGLLKPFIDRKLYDMIYTHTSDEMDALLEIIRPEMLPMSEGGEMCVEEKRKEIIETIAKYQQWFLDDERLGRVDESKRKRKAGRFSWLFSYSTPPLEGTSQEFD